MPPRVHIPSQPCPYAKLAQRFISNAPSTPAKANKASERTLSATTLTPKGQIPPESPKFIDVPRSLQPEQIWRPWVKGVLPVPRQIFSRTSETDKTSAKYLNQTAAEPRRKSSTTPLKAGTAPIGPARNKIVEYASYKYQQSALRRRNLRESLVELHERKQRDDHAAAARSAAKHAQSLRLAYAPEREDERLTNPTIHSAIHPAARGALPDPNREARIAQKRANVADMQAQREEDRRTMLHTLYMNARDFIIDPQVLDKEIDRVFDDPDSFTNDTVRGMNVWALGLPQTVEQMLNAASRKPGGKAIDRDTDFGLLEKKRIDRIAEEFTGGKI